MLPEIQVTFVCDNLMEALSIEELNSPKVVLGFRVTGTPREF